MLQNNIENLLKGNIEKLKEKKSTEKHPISMVVDIEYEYKWKEILKYYNERMESAPSRTEIYRNAIDIIHGELYGDTNN